MNLTEKVERVLKKLNTDDVESLFENAVDVMRSAKKEEDLDAVCIAISPFLYGCLYDVLNEQQKTSLSLNIQYLEETWGDLETRLDSMQMKN